jgi:hypothetical protein
MTTTADHTDVALPAGADWADTWESGGGDRRVILGIKHTITDSDVTVSTACIQHIDGAINDGGTDECPTVYIDQPVEPNSDQARELAAPLLESAALIDGWVGR